MKGLVVEQHADRIILSMEKGEVPILLSRILEIQYGDLAQNLMQVGRAYESQGKLGEALAYYEKAMEINPELEEAAKAAMGVRNRFWSAASEGPRDEMEKKQLLYDAWGQGRSFEELIGKQKAVDVQALKERLGVALERTGDWTRLNFVDPKKDAALVSLKKNDRLISVDGQSLRYLSVDVVRKNLLVPRYANFVLEYERDCFVHKDSASQKLKDLGSQLKLEHKGLVVRSVKAKSPAETAGLKKGDLLTQVDGESTRYLPAKKVIELIEDPEKETVVFTVRRSALLTRR